MSPRTANQFLMRPMTLDDTEIVAGWLRDLDDLSLFERNLPVPLRPDAVRETWKDDLAGGKLPAAFWFTVEADGTPVAIGGLQSINYIHGDGVLPILVTKSTRGLGLGLGIAVILLDMAFDRLRMHRITTYFRADNLRSERLTRRLGFHEEGRMRQAWFADGKHQDCVMVGLLRDEWYSTRSVLKSELKSVNIALASIEKGSVATVA